MARARLPTRRGLAKPGTFGVRRTLLDEPLDDFFFDQNTATRSARRGRARTASPRRRSSISTCGAGSPNCRSPHAAPGFGITFAWKGTTVLASPNLQTGSGGGAVDVIDMKTWKPVTTIATTGTGILHAHHEATPYA